MADNNSVGVSKKVILVIAVITQFVLTSVGSSVNIALPAIGKEFSMGAVLLGWVVTSFLLASAAFLVPFGRLADIYGRKKIFLYGILLFTVASFLSSIADSTVLLVSSRALAGIGGAMTLGTVIAILTSVFPAEERGRAIGISMAATYSGLSLGPFIGGVLTQHLGWRSIFFLSAFLALIVAVLIVWKLKGEWAEAQGERFDVVGSIAFGLSIIVMMYGFTVLPTSLGIALVLLGASGLLVFIWWEAKVGSPVFNVSIFKKNAVFVFSNLAALISYSAVFAISFLLSLYLQYIGGFSPQTAGLVLVISPVVMTIFAPIAGRLSDRVEPRLVASIGMVFLFVALVLFVFLDDKANLGFVIACLVIYGIGIGLFSSPNTNAVMGSVDKRFFGVASGTVATMRTVGMILSMGIMMILFSIYIGQAQVTPEYYPAFLTSIKVGFIVYSVICFGGIFAQLAGRRTRQA